MAAVPTRELTRREMTELGSSAGVTGRVVDLRGLPHYCVRGVSKTLRSLVAKI